MTWLQTYTGKAFDLAAPTADMVDVLDIGHALSQQCRYAGHTHRFYSVAEHCCLLYDYAKIHAPAEAGTALLHDVAEAYVIDVPRPLKRMLTGYAEIEQRVEAVLSAYFGVALMSPTVAEWDLRICLDERDQLHALPPRPWSIDGGPLGITVRGWQPEQAKAEWMMRYLDWRWRC